MGKLGSAPDVAPRASRREGVDHLLGKIHVEQVGDRGVDRDVQIVPRLTPDAELVEREGEHPPGECSGQA
jgi:hypothetical protein